MQRSTALILASLLFTSACSDGPSHEADDGGTPDAQVSDAAPRPDARPMGVDAGPVLPLCTDGDVTVRGIVEGGLIEEREEFMQISQRGTGVGVAPPISFASTLGGNLLFMARPTAIEGDGSLPASTLVHADGRLFCGGEGARMLHPADRLEVTLPELHALGACADAPSVEGTISGCGTGERCTVTSTLEGNAFESLANNGLARGEGWARLDIELDNARGNVWLWSEGDDVQLGLLYLPSPDGIDARVYCIGAADIVDFEQWTLRDLRDLGTCLAAPAVDGSLQACAWADRD